MSDEKDLGIGWKSTGNGTGAKEVSRYLWMLCMHAGFVDTCSLRSVMSFLGQLRPLPIQRLSVSCLWRARRKENSNVGSGESWLTEDACVR